jgi:hypothetical protein
LPPLRLLDALGERVLVVVIAHRHADLGDDRPGVHSGIDEVQGRARDLHPVREGVAGAVDAGKRRQQRIVGVDVPAAELGQEPGADQLSEAGGDDQVGCVPRARLGQRRVPLLAAGVVLDPDHERRDAAIRRAGQAGGAVTVRACRDHESAVLRIGARVQQRLQVGTRTGYQDQQAGGPGRSRSFGHDVP